MSKLLQKKSDPIRQQLTVFQTFGAELEEMAQRIESCVLLLV